MDTAGPWEAHAGRDKHNGGFRDIGHPLYVKAHGHDEVVKVTLTRSPDGPYWGWMGRTQWSSGKDDTVPCMIQQHKGMFNMQFAYGPEAEQERGKGEIIRLDITESRLDTTNEGV